MRAVITVLVNNSGLAEASDGRGSKIRTCDPLLPKQVRYQTALCPDHIAGYEQQPGQAEPRHSQDT